MDKNSSGNGSPFNFDDISSYSSPKEYNKKRKNKRGRVVLKSIIAVFCCLLIGGGIALTYISTDLLSGLSTVSISKDKDVLGIPDLDLNTDSVVNIALFGVDTRGNTFTGNADTIMILSVDNKHNKIKLISILRDSTVLIEGQGDKGYINWVTKINAAYAEGGPELAIRTINTNFNTNIYDYVTVNFVQMAKIVEAFGGTTITITDAEMQQINNNLAMTMKQNSDSGVTENDYINESGRVHLNGNQAVAYGRIRKIDSDFERVKRQQAVVSGLLESAAKLPKSEYYSLAKELFPMCETSFNGFDDIFALAPIIINGFTIEKINVPDAEVEVNFFDGEDSSGIWVLTYDLDVASQRIEAFIYEDQSQYYEWYKDYFEGLRNKNNDN